MNLDLGSFAFGSYLNSGSGTPSWGTALGQSKPDYKVLYWKAWRRNISPDEKHQNK